MRRALVLLLVLAAGCKKPAPAVVQQQVTSVPPVVSVAAPKDAGAALDASVAARPTFNVLLILIDSLRADADRRSRRHSDMPRIGALAEESTVYSNAYSISSTTARSVAPLLVGRYPSEMERNGIYFTRWYPSNDFLSEHLQKRGVKSLGAFAHAYFYKSSGMSQGFDQYELLPGTILNPEPEASGERLTKLMRGMLTRATRGGEAQFFAYVHYLDPHAPYVDHQSGDAGPVVPPGDAGEPIDPRELYREEVRYSDQCVGDLVDWVKTQKWGARTAIIVSADHGECFGEHKQQKHGYELWQELVRVPLIVYVPGASHRIIDVPRSHIDLAPTILELMGAPPDAKHRGKSLVSELHGATPEARPVVLDLPRDNLQDRRRAVVDGHDKIIARGDDERWLFYDLETDPHEKKNLTEVEEARFRRMKKLYEEISESIPVEEVHGDVKLKNAPEGQRF